MLSKLFLKWSCKVSSKLLFYSYYRFQTGKGFLVEAVDNCVRHVNSFSSNYLDWFHWVLCFFNWAGVGVIYNVTNVVMLYICWWHRPWISARCCGDLCMFTWNFLLLTSFRQQLETVRKASVEDFTPPMSQLSVDSSWFDVAFIEPWNCYVKR